MKKIFKLTLGVMLLALMALPATQGVKAMSYNYDFFKNVIPSAEGLSYETTYYKETIKPANESDTGMIPTDGLLDMEVYQDKIYLINTSNTSTTFNLHNATSTTAAITATDTTISNIIVLNDQFKWEKIINEFPFCQDKISPDSEETIEERLVATLKEHYSYKDATTEEYKSRAQLNLESITADNFKSTDLATRSPYVPYTGDNSRYALRLRNAEGITVTKDGIYIADTENSRIVQLNFNYEVVNIFLSPDDVSFYQLSSGLTVLEAAGAATQFKPTKVAVDISGRVYCIAKDIYEGVIEFAKARTETRTGQFNRFLGKNEVVANPLKAFWAKIFSETQLSSIALDLPPMFTNITIDSDGFLYATSLPDNDAETGTTQANMVKIINTAGKDIMKRNGYVKPNGDASYVIASTDVSVVLGPSTLVAVAIDNEYGIYTTVDSKRGRLFTYDTEGNLLYVTGVQPAGTATQGSGQGLSNSLVNPVAIDYFKRSYKDKNNEDIYEDLVIALDKFSQSIIVYKTTEFGKNVNLATSCYQDGKIEDAEKYWNEVNRINTNYELAYLGIGKSILRRAGTIEEYKEAMSYFEKAHNAIYYSKAYDLYRSVVLKKNFAWIMTSAVVLVVAYVGWKVYKAQKRRASKPYDEGGDL